MGIVYSPMNDYTALFYICHSLYFPYTAISKEISLYIQHRAEAEFLRCVSFQAYSGENRIRTCTSISPILSGMQLAFESINTVCISLQCSRNVYQFRHLSIIIFQYPLKIHTQFCSVYISFLNWDMYLQN